MTEEKNIFGSKTGAQKMLTDKLEDVIALLRNECNIYDAKLETHPAYDQQNTIAGYWFIGKVRFSEDAEFEDENEMERFGGGYTVLFKYYLSREARTKDDKIKASRLRQEAWFLEKVD